MKKDWSKPRNLGWFFPDPGTHTNVHCGICDTKMDVELNKSMHTTMAGALSGIKHQVDLFTCPHRDTSWHRKITILISEANNYESDRIKSLIHEEIDNLLEAKQSFLNRNKSKTS